MAGSRLLPKERLLLIVKTKEQDFQTFVRKESSGRGIKGGRKWKKIEKCLYAGSRTGWKANERIKGRGGEERRGHVKKDVERRRREVPRERERKKKKKEKDEPALLASWRSRAATQNSFRRFGCRYLYITYGTRATWLLLRYLPLLTLATLATRSLSIPLDRFRYATFRPYTLPREIISRSIFDRT